METIYYYKHGGIKAIMPIKFIDYSDVNKELMTKSSVFNTAYYYNTNIYGAPSWCDVDELKYCTKHVEGKKTTITLQNSAKIIITNERLNNYESEIDSIILKNPDCFVMLRPKEIQEYILFDRMSLIRYQKLNVNVKQDEIFDNAKVYCFEITQEETFEFTNDPRYNYLTNI